MQLKRVLRALIKNKIEVTQVDRWGSGNITFIAKNGDRDLEFRENGKDSGYITHFTARHPDTDASVDLFMDSYFNTIKGAVNYLKGAK